MFQCLFVMVEQHGIKGMETIRVVLIMKPTFSFFSLHETQNQDGNSEILRDHSPYLKVFP